MLLYIVIMYLGIIPCNSYSCSLSSLHYVDAYRHRYNFLCFTYAFSSLNTMPSTEYRNVALYFYSWEESYSLELSMVGINSRGKRLVHKRILHCLPSSMATWNSRTVYLIPLKFSITCGIWHITPLLIGSITIHCLRFILLPHYLCQKNSRPLL